eukprot:Clim_evm14s191 gene=Clim_evmTU14s191
MCDLLYLKDPDLHETEAEVTHVGEVAEDGKNVPISLNQTPFYPQGGGQPSDRGHLHILDDADVLPLNVQKVQKDGDVGVVHHVGHEERGVLESLKVGTRLKAKVDSDLRHWHCRLHSGGHLIDDAVKKCGYHWVSGKAYHFPDGPYVEYEGNLPAPDREGAVKALNDACVEIMASDVIKNECQVLMVPYDDLERVTGQEVPDFLEKGQPCRVVNILGTPDGVHLICGGTHVKKAEDIGKVTIKKIKVKGRKIKVQYTVTPGP